MAKGTTKSPWDEARIAVQNNEPEVAKERINWCIKLYERRFYACPNDTDNVAKEKAFVMHEYARRLLDDIEKNVTIQNGAFTKSISEMVNALSEADKKQIATYSKVLPFVVEIHANETIQEDGTKKYKQCGTGAIIGVGTNKEGKKIGYIITNAHVVKGAEDNVVATFKSQNKTLKIEKVHIGDSASNFRDLALYGFNIDSDMEVSPMGCIMDYEKVVEAGLKVLKYGNDLDYGLGFASGDVKYKKIERGNYEGLLGCNISSLKGDSGAPIFLSDGQYATACIGINMGIIASYKDETVLYKGETALDEGAIARNKTVQVQLSNFELAIPMNKVIEFLKEAEDKGITIKLNEVK